MYPGWRVASVGCYCRAIRRVRKFENIRFVKDKEGRGEGGKGRRQRKKERKDTYILVYYVSAKYNQHGDNSTSQDDQRNAHGLNIGKQLCCILMLFPSFRFVSNWFDYSSRTCFSFCIIRCLSYFSFLTLKPSKINISIISSTKQILFLTCCMWTIAAWWTSACSNVCYCSNDASNPKRKW